MWGWYVGEMKWRYLKKYYGRLSLRRELVYVFWIVMGSTIRYICRQLRLTQQECFLMLLLMGYYMLLKENEKLKRKNRNIQRIDEQT